MPDDEADKTQKSNAKIRLEGIAQHHLPKPSKPRRQRKPKAAEPPADWSDVLAELEHVRKLAQTPKTNTTGYQRQIQGGKLWIRDRVELSLDADSFREVGSSVKPAT